MSFCRKDSDCVASTRVVGVVFLALCLTLGIVAVAWANPTVITDSTTGTATNDGNVDPTEYSGYSEGINSGGGGTIGSGSKVYVDSGGVDDAIHFGLVPAPTSSLANYYIVTYIDSVTGGFPSTKAFEDDLDWYRSAVSGYNRADSTDLYFAPNFAADYAVSLTAQRGDLYQLAAGGDDSLTFVKSVNLNPAGNGGAGEFEFDFLMSDIGLSPGQSFKYVITLTFPNNNPFWRYNEFHGVSQTTADAHFAGAQGTSVDFYLQEGDYNQFSTGSPANVGGLRAEVTDFNTPQAIVIWPLLLGLLTVPLLLRRRWRR